MSKEFIVLIPTDYVNAKSVAKSFENKTFNSLGSIGDEIVKGLLSEDDNDEQERVLVFSVNGFTKAINYDEVNMSNYITTNVFVE
jgi:hypothetical protein